MSVIPDESLLAKHDPDVRRRYVLAALADATHRAGDGEYYACRIAAHPLLELVFGNGPILDQVGMLDLEQTSVVLLPDADLHHPELAESFAERGFDIDVHREVYR